MWCNGLTLEEWEDSVSDEEITYLHGKCDEWILEHFQDGDIAVIWSEYNPVLNKVCLIHCYIKRGDKFVDVRGETDSLEDMEDGFDYWLDNDPYECYTLEEYKKMIRKICHYRDEKWK